MFAEVYDLRRQLLKRLGGRPETHLPTISSAYQMVEWCGRAMADVLHEIAAAEFGWDSPEEEAVYQEQERSLKNLLYNLSQQERTAKVDFLPLTKNPFIRQLGL